MLPASASWARRTASDERQVLRDGEGTAGQVARHQRRQPPAQPGRRHRGRGARPQEQRDHDGDHEVDELGLLVPHLAQHDRVRQGEDRRDPTAPPGGEGAAVDVPRQPPDDRLEHPPAVQRQPGDQVDQAHQQVGAGEAPDRQQQQPVGRHGPQRQRRATHGERRQRPDDGDHQLVLGRASLPLDGGHPAQEVQGDRAHRVAVVPGHQRVRGLVDEHRAVEDDREGQPRDVLQRPQPGLGVLHRRRHHDGDQRRDQQPRRRHVDARAGDAADAQRAGRRRRRRLGAGV